MSAGAGAAVPAALVSVGSELLLGDLVDTNAAWIGKRLAEQGVAVVLGLAVGDEQAALVDALRVAARRARLVVVGGGLGPTVDDLTREAVAAFAGVELEHRDELEAAIAERFARLRRPMAEQNRRQARVPVGARAVEPAGTAPAFAIDVDGAGPDGATVTVVALPGVPWELHELWDRFVVGEVARLAPAGAIVTRLVHTAGRGESEVAAIVEPLLAGRDDVTLAFLAKQHGVQVRLTVRGSDAADARRASEPALAEVVAALGPEVVVGLDEEDLETTVVRLLAEAGQRVATAESASAGAICARLGRVPRASRVLRGGAVVYATEAKRDVLGIDAALIERHGAVSAEVTEALALAARERFDADWGLAVTGVAGPGTVDGLPVGTVFWALAHPDGHVESHGRELPGDRATVIARLGSAALDLLRRRLSGR
jgi:nicotinamide-nucleotide amidase